MSPWMKAVAYAMIALFLGFILREMGFHGSRLVVIIGVVATIGVGVLIASEIIDRLLVLGGDFSSSGVKLMLKILGVGYVSGVCSDVCLDLGENGLAGAILHIGKIEMLLICVPSVISVVEKGVELIS